MAFCSVVVPAPVRTRTASTARVFPRTITSTASSRSFGMPNAEAKSFPPPAGITPMRAVLLKSREIHALRPFVIFRKLLPHKSAARILGHPERDSRIDSQHVRARPAGQRVERIHEPVLFPDALPKFLSNVLQYPNAFLWHEYQRTARRARNDAPINSAHCRWPAPYCVSMLRIGCRDSPQIIRVVRKSLRKFDAPHFVYPRRHNRIRKIIRVFVVRAAEIEPRVRELMRKERRVRSHINNFVELKTRPLPLVPHRRR